MNETWDRRSRLFRSLVKALRAHQWAKNVLVFLPLLTAHRLDDRTGIGHAVGAFIALCLVASAGYIINDLADLRHDREHPTKQHRPLASGAFPLRYAAAIAPVLFIAGLFVALVVSGPLAAIVACYFGLAVGYSFAFKGVLILDVIVLSLLYTVRVIAGAVAVPVPASFWLLAFTSFLFLSLAMLKRFVELASLSGQGAAKTPGRGYDKADASMIAILGTGSGLVSVLLMALYIESPGIAALYGSPQVLWFLALLMLYWIARAWLLAPRGKIHDDPVVFAMTDRTSIVVAVLAGIVIWAATMP